MFIDLKNGIAVHSDFVRSAIVKKAYGKFYVNIRMRPDNSQANRIPANRVYEVQFNEIEELNTYIGKYFQMDPMIESQIEERE